MLVHVSTYQSKPFWNSSLLSHSQIMCLYIPIYTYIYVYASICLKIHYVFHCLFKKGIYHMFFFSRGLSQMDAMVAFFLFSPREAQNGLWLSDFSQGTKTQLEAIWLASSGCREAGLARSSAHRSGSFKRSSLILFSSICLCIYMFSFPCRF